VSILASDCQGQEITVSEKQISVKDSSYNERGFVIRVYKDGLYSEYSFDEILTVDEIVEEIAPEAEKEKEEPKKKKGFFGRLFG
jgi:TldD protein